MNRPHMTPHLPLLDGVQEDSPPAKTLQPPRRPAPRKAIFVTGLGLGLLVSTIAVEPAPRLIWNASASAPIGLYGNRPDAAFARGDMVIARVPEPFRAMAAARRYIPANVPLVKHVAAVPGDTVCAFGQEILFNGRQVGERLLLDGHGRALPQWHGCRRLARGQYFLMMPGLATSFDGRYFGPTETRDIVGRADPLWTR